LPGLEVDPEIRQGFTICRIRILMHAVRIPTNYWGQVIGCRGSTLLPPLTIAGFYIKKMANMPEAPGNLQVDPKRIPITITPDRS